MAQLVPIDLAHELKVNHSLAPASINFLSIHLGVVKPMVQSREGRAGSGANDPVRLLLLHQLESPVTVGTAREIPVLSIWAKRPEVKGSKATNIEALVGLGCLG